MIINNVCDDLCVCYHHLWLLPPFTYEKRLNVNIYSWALGDFNWSTPEAQLTLL